MHRRNHPQYIRAQELARKAGIERLTSYENRDTYREFMDAAFDEHFKRTAVKGIYWDHGGSFYTERWDTCHHDGDWTFSYGRCKTGQRFLWCVNGWQWGDDSDDRRKETYGYADSEDEALAAGMAAILKFTKGSRTIAHVRHNIASRKLRELATAKRAARPPKTGTRKSTEVEYLYTDWRSLYDQDGWLEPLELPIIKKTKKLIFFKNPHGDYNCTVDRARMEAAGTNGAWARLYSYRERIYLQRPPHPYESEREQYIDIKGLKAAMAAAHPDKGGSSAAFIAARKRYLAALKQSQSGGMT
jgi:hypothetical protein